MAQIDLSRMFEFEAAAWTELARVRPSVRQLTLYFVVPMSLIPPLMHAFVQTAYPGRVLPLVEPPFSAPELFLVGAAFFAIELAMVYLMAAYAEQIAGSAGINIGHAEAYTLAGVAPTPLWLAPLALFVPSTAFNVAVMAAAWLGCVLLIRHGIRPLFGIDDTAVARRLADAMTIAGVAAWIALLILMTMVIGIVVGWR